MRDGTRIRPASKSLAVMRCVGVSPAGCDAERGRGGADRALGEGFGRDTEAGESEPAFGKSPVAPVMRCASMRSSRPRRLAKAITAWSSSSSYRIAAGTASANVRSIAFSARA